MQFALGTVTVLALLMTIAMGVVTWRLVREERRRSAARLAALATELKARGIDPTTAAPRDQPTDEPQAEVEVIPHPLPVQRSEEHQAEPNPPRADLFDRPSDSTGGWQRRLAGFGVAGALLAVLVSVAVFAVSGGERDDGSAGPDEVDRVPVELLTLAHERQDGMLAISGTVRNPLQGLEESQLSVMAMAFNEEGAMIASGRTQLEAEMLPAGAESSFTISLPAEQASRYRISFLADETTIPHLDRRTTTTLQETES